jgi:hypothetical protein
MRAGVVFPALEVIDAGAVRDLSRRWRSSASLT